MRRRKTTFYCLCSVSDVAVMLKKQKQNRNTPSSGLVPNTIIFLLHFLLQISVINIDLKKCDIPSKQKKMILILSRIRQQ